MSKLKIAVLASGGGSNLQAIIDAVQNGRLNLEIAVVIVDRKEAFAKERAEKVGIPSYYVGKGNCASSEEISDKTLDLLIEHDVDLVVLAGYLNILSPKCVSVFKNRIINIHPSLIPKYCGMHFHGEKVHEAVLEAGESESGATIHFVDAGVDTGEIIAQFRVGVYENDTVETLKKRVLDVEHHLLVATLKDIETGHVRLG